jgi:glycosyltransferase involved in cell wall biosynthesis
MRVLLIGALNRGKTPRGGEEYKNQLLHTYLIKQYETSIVDTQGWKKKPSVLLTLVIKLFFKRWDGIIISASSHSVYTLVSFLQFFPTISSKTTYFVIGGYFPSALAVGIFKKKPYEKLKAIVVEGVEMRNTLVKCGLQNDIFVVPNFKVFPKNIKSVDQTGSTFKFIFLSRIHPDKGVGEIIEASRLLVNSGIVNFSIDFFGPIDGAYKTQFESLCRDNIHYNGVLDIMKDTTLAYETLSGFDAMLFPTYWRGEGFPGALVDAFVAGLPVIASKWNMNSEVIQDGYNGLLVPPQNAVALAEAMCKLMMNNQLKVSLAKASRAGAERFHIDEVWPDISKIIEK